jgi:hypothetical protein
MTIMLGRSLAANASEGRQASKEMHVRIVFIRRQWRVNSGGEDYRFSEEPFQETPGFSKRNCIASASRARRAPM